MNSLREVQGFSLLEILITMVVLSIGLLAMASVSTGVMKSNIFSSKLTTATALAREKMEAIRGKGFLLASAGKTTEEYGTIPLYLPFKRIVTIGDVASPQDKMRQVTVCVYWDGDAHHAEVTTIIVE